MSPKGWIELAEFSFTLRCDDGTMPADWPPLVLWGLIREAVYRQNRLAPADRGETLKHFLEDAGFVDVQTKVMKCPTGVWPKNEKLKQAGRFTLLSVETAYEAWAMMLCTTVLGMPESEVKELCEKAKNAHLDRKVHAYWEL